MAEPRAAAAAALVRWVEAVNAYGDRAITAAAVSPAIAIERCGFGDQRGQVVQNILGLDATVQWLAMTRDVVQFQCDVADLSTTDSAWVVRYRLTAPDDFVGGGSWTIRLDPDGMLLWLRHQPDEL